MAGPWLRAKPGKLVPPRQNQSEYIPNVLASMPKVRKQPTVATAGAPVTHSALALAAGG